MSSSSWDIDDTLMQRLLQEDAFVSGATGKELRGSDSEADKKAHEQKEKEEHDQHQKQRQEIKVDDAKGQGGRNTLLKVEGSSREERRHGMEERATIKEEKLQSEVEPTAWWHRHILEALEERRAQLGKPTRGLRLDSFCSGAFAEGWVAKA
jgi:hypothetical protein